MYDVKPIDERVYLRGSDGSIDVYESYNTFIQTFDYYGYKDRLVQSLPEWKFYRWKPINWDIYPSQFQTKYVLTSPSGEHYSYFNLMYDLSNYHVKRYQYTFNYRIRGNFEFRKDPVPFTGKKQWYFRCYYKRPKTTNEMRANYAHIEFVRGKRNPINLPSAWDDVVRGDVRNNKSWKNQKKRKQWM